MNTKLFLILALFLVFARGQFAKAAVEGTVLCTTPRLSKSFLVRSNSISFFDAYEFEKKREIASVTGVRTKITPKGYTKVVFHNGQKHTIHIEDLKSFSEVDDYLVIRSNKGHEMTYPLHCSTK